MHIKEIEIDGFKSYAQKQIIGPFDEQFNAITGLNGSGKSNILDSICFVLGITNLSCIRAQNNNDLIFKQGNAGITKAFVKITFDNRRGRRFTSYGDLVTITRTISISSGSAKGSNNYTICGSNASCSAVADMFRSVGLNVNNPHFLIMQGRITKVLNMKPLEILGMIEEAAGTKQYDTKRNQALLNMEKKDQKIEDIKQLMEKEIMPTVQRMKDDREEFLKYQKYERDLLLYRRKHAAFTYDQAVKNMRACKEEMEAKEKEKNDMAELVQEMKVGIETMLAKQKEMEREKEEVLKKEKEELDDEIKKRRNTEMSCESKLDELKSKVSELSVKIARTNNTIAVDKKALTRLNEELAKKEGEIGGEEQRGNDMEAAIKAAKAKLVALEQGMTTNEAGEVVSLESQITESRTRLTEITTDVKAYDARKKELERKRIEREKDLTRYEREDSDFTRYRARMESEYARIQTEMENMTFNEAEYLNRKEELRKLTLDMKELDRVQRVIEEEMRFKEARLNGRRSHEDVLGMVPRFFKLLDESSQHAIESLLGSHLYTTVVRSGKAGAQLMKDRAFQRRTTCIPMDGRMRDNTTEKGRKLKLARSIAPHGEKVDFAIDLVEYRNEHEFICKYMLGEVLIVDTKDTAHSLCFNKDLKMRVLTRNGEFDFKPSGIVGGGARGRCAGGIDLMQTNRWHDARKRLAEIEPELEALREKIAGETVDAEKYSAMKEKLVIINEQMEAHKEKFKFSASATIRADLDAINEELPELDEKLKNSMAEMKDLKEKIRQFEERKKNEKAFADKEKADCRRLLKQLTDDQIRAKGGFENARATLSIMRTEITSLTESINDGEEATVKYQREEAEATEQLKVADKEWEDARAEVIVWVKKREQLLEKIKEQAEHANQLRKTVEKNKKEIQQRENKIEELERERERLGADVETWRKDAKTEKKAHPWIEDEKEHFGQPGTDYDFAGYSFETGKKRIDELEGEMKKMNSNINANTMNMLAPSEERVLALQKKRVQIEKDKQKLMETIEKLDEKKKVELLAAYKSVNKDFNGIFSTLLPGTSAKLDPADGKDPLNGTEIKVAFNNKWKESLGELSGGQRSLVALSLVLAMLKFRPAPLYILDEVDAALDLSHTQNIGAMIKTHFKESQFIIVSLKEGMFNNANIIFRTRFVDGTSHVNRHDNTNK